MAETRCENIRQYTAGDRLNLKYRAWAAGNEPDALVYLHGIESHSEWFSECAELLCATGVGLYALDRRGSGLNAAERGHCSDYRRLVQDVAEFAAGATASHERLHLAGLSWGGKLAVAVDMIFPGLFTSITLLAPGIFPKVAPGPFEKFRIAFDMLFRSRALHPIPIDDDMFTSIPKYLRFIANDPLRLRNVTAGFYRESFKMDKFLKRRNYHWTAPTQLLLAERDAIMDNRKLQNMFDSLQMQCKRVLLYKGCNHSFQFEKPDDVARDIAQWMREAPKVRA
jgi:alpha-beta hydrolase superfamily lysophospholipase